MPEARHAHVDTSPKVADEIKTTTCYMCACRCGIKVYLQDGQVRYIEGNRDHPVNKGVLCGKGAAGIMQHLSPARLRAPMKRVGPRGSGEFVEIGWEEALALATDWLGEVRARDPKRLAFFTGRDQSQSLTGWWAIQYGTPNYAAHGGFCSVNMAAAGLYTFGGSFWEFGEPDWELTEYFMLWGVAEDHGSNPIKKGLGKLKERGTKVVSVNPVRTGYGAIADEWLGIRPGTDGLLAGALVHELMAAGRIDLDYLVRYTNAHWLIIQAPGADDDGLIARNGAGRPLAWDKGTGGLAEATASGIVPAVVGSYTLEDGRRAVPVLELIARRFLGEDYSPDAVAGRTGIPADTIRRIARELAEAAFEREVVLDVAWTDWTGKRHDKMIGRPVSLHAMRGISAHSNGFQTCRTIHLLQILLGSIDCPGGFRYKAPYPKSVPPPLKPHGRLDSIKPNTPLGGPHLGFPTSPADLLLCDDGVTPCRIDKGFSWDAPLSAHGLMHMVITNAGLGDPYPIDVLFLYMANMSWNSAMNVPDTIGHLTARDPVTGDYKVPKIIYSDAYYSEMVAYADLILPDTTYLERWDCISMLDRPISEPDAPADAIRQPVVEPDRDVRGFQSVLIDLGARLALPGFVTPEGSPRYPGGYSDYMVNHERAPGVGPLAGWRGADGKSFGKGAPNPDQLSRYIENGCFHAHHLAEGMRYFKHANRDHLEWAHSVGMHNSTDPVIFQLYSEPLQRFRLSARGHGAPQPPASHRERIEAYFDPLPFWYPPFEEEIVGGSEYPFHAITQRPMHMYHSWGSQNAWLRQITGQNRLFMNRQRAEALAIADDDWVWLTSHVGRVKCQVRLMEGCNADTLWTWNAIGKRGGAWGLDPDSAEIKKGFLLNHLIGELLPEREGGYRYSNSDPITGQAAWYDLRVRIEKAAHDERETSEPRFEPIAPMPDRAPGLIQYGRQFEDQKP
ncbi:MAG: molybdopterin-dependent oxidoreductase [Rhizobiales bacterium]|nr:molybdopterin-dependent oxidoreductase [Hyphomicrobiales bacterium]